MQTQSIHANRNYQKPKLSASWANTAGLQMAIPPASLYLMRSKCQSCLATRHYDNWYFAHLVRSRVAVWR